MTKPIDALIEHPLHGVQLIPNNSQNTQALKKRTNVPFSLPVNCQLDKQIVKPPANTPIWTLTDQGQRYSTYMALHKQQNTIRLHIDCEGTGTFTYHPNELEINWQTAGTGFDHYLQSMGIAVWLETQGIPCLHANTLTYQNKAYLVIAPSRTGKSTLTTQLLGQDLKLMTDDMAALHPQSNGQYLVYPSWPKVRLWPDSAKSLLGPKFAYTQASSNDKAVNVINTEITSNKHNHLANALAGTVHKPVHQKFAKHELDLSNSSSKNWGDTPAKLSGIYFLNRQQHSNTLCDIQKINPSQALMLLIQNSILANAYSALGLERSRVTQLANILNKIPSFSINYQSGLDCLPDVANNVKQHIHAL